MNYELKKGSDKHPAPFYIMRCAVGTAIGCPRTRDARPYICVFLLVFVFGYSLFDFFVSLVFGGDVIIFVFFVVIGFGEL